MSSILGKNAGKAPDEDNKGDASETETNLGQNENGVQPEIDEAALAQAQARRARSQEALARLSDRLPPSEEELEEANANGDSAPEPIAAFKHRAVRHFKVGPFEFRNHILYITEESALEEFLNAYEGLPLRDKNEIVKYDWEAAAKIESPVNAARGSLSTGQIKDSKRIQ